jgi:hypothetical protein
MAKEQSRNGGGGFLAGLDRRGQQRFQGVVEWFGRRDRGLAWHHTLGERVHVLREAARQPLYGSRWVRELAERLGCSRDLIYKALAFHRKFPNAQVADLEKAGVSWKMVVVALGVPDRTGRSKLLLRAARKRWTWDDLRLYIKQAHPSRRPGSGRPPKARSYEPGAGLEHLAKTTRQWLSNYKGTWADGPDTLLGRLKTLKRADYDAALLDRLRHAQDLLGQTARDARNLKKALTAFAARVALKLGDVHKR